MSAVFNTTGTTFETTDPLDNFAGINGVTIPAGITLYGNFTAVQLVSGTVVAYRR